MAVPFSNTNLRIPRGFGNLLEGLAREVLRDQPEDIPNFAAVYFTELLKAREESGQDPAEWGAKLEDRFYNNHSFKSTAKQGNIISPKINSRNNTGRSQTFGNNRTQLSVSKDPQTNNSEDNEAKLDERLGGKSGEREHRLAEDTSDVDTANVDICTQDPKEVLEETLEVAKEAIDIDICRSELEPTAIPSFGGLANVDICAEEINLPSEPAESYRKPDSPKPLPVNEDQSESQDEIHSHMEQDAVKQAEMSDHHDDDGENDDGQTEDDKQGVLEIADNFLEDTDPDGKSTEQVYVEESAESTMEKHVTESIAEAGQESEDPNNEDREETNYEYTSTNDFVEDAADSTSDINSRSLIEMKDTYIDNSAEILDSKSEVIDVLDEVHHQCNSHAGESEAENSSDDEDTSKMIDALNEDDFLETPKPISQSNDSETEVSNELLNADVITASEKDINTENVNEGSDLDSNGCDAEEMDLDISNMPQPNALKSEDEEDDRTHDAKPIEGDFPSEVEQADSEQLESGTVVITEEHATESQEKTENPENDADQEDQLDEQTDERHELALESENLENADSSEPKEECSQPQEEEDIMDIPLDDPEANKAAAKIQAGFRGHMTRKKMKPGEKPNEEVSSSGEALNGSQGDSGGTDGVETEATSGPEQ